MLSNAAFLNIRSILISVSFSLTANLTVAFFLIQGISCNSQGKKRLFGMSKGHSFHEVVEESISALHVRVNFSGMEPNSMLVRLAAVFGSTKTSQGTYAHISVACETVCTLVFFFSFRKKKKKKNLAL